MATVQNPVESATRRSAQGWSAAPLERLGLRLDGLDMAGPVGAPEVILVDDDAAVLASLKFDLELQGYAVRAYPTAESLLERTDLPESGCLVLDYHLPVLNGLELLGRLRARGVALPAVLITTPRGDLPARAAAAGVGVVEKPLLSNTLPEAISRLLAPAGAPPAAPV